MVMRPRSIPLLSENLALSTPWVGGGAEVGTLLPRRDLAPSDWRGGLCWMFRSWSPTCIHRLMPECAWLPFCGPQFPK